MNKTTDINGLDNSTLFSYTLRFDDGVAPNPYWGICTLAICKPVIRRVAKVGDWIVGLGSKNSPLGDISQKIVYIMKITKKLSLKEYNDYCIKQLPNKIPDIYNKDHKRHLGDCIYDFSNANKITLRESVHVHEDISTDLGGINALLSDNFYYFGNNPINLDDQFWLLIKSNQGHRSVSNNNIKKQFVEWFLSKGYERNKLYGLPQRKIDLLNKPDCKTECSIKQKQFWESMKNRKIDKNCRTCHSLT
jgi:hypothetical protein